MGEVGSNKTVIASYATGSVTGSGNSFGGLVGYARSGATFTASYATGNASGDSQIGGLVGYGSDITVIASYATGSVTASSSNVGGLVGYGPGTTVIASYATGRVSGVSSVGGLVGYGPGTTFIASYWDTGTSGQRSGVGSGNENVAGAEGKTTAELQSPTGDTGIYVAWNTDLDNADVDGNPATGAEDFWDFGTSSQYPALKADIDGNGVATWQEFGGQGRVPPPTPPLLPTPPPTVNGKYDGDGDRLIEVSNLEQLSAVRYDVNGDGRPDRDSDSLVYSLAFPVGGTEAVCDKRCHGYELAGPLDFGEAGSYASGAVRSGWTSGSGWEPIGVDTSGRRFSATFDGNGHTVSNLYIDRAIGSDLSSGVGLFGVAGESSVIRGIGLVNAEVHGYSRVGGLVGKHSGTINDSYATGTVTGSDDYVGGLVGENSGQVSDSYAASTVSGGADVGGLVGLHSGTISDSYATGSVTGSGNSVGGLVGRSTGPISDSYATGSVTGSGNSFGGLVGEVGSNKTVIASYATGSVTGSGNSFGGLVGYARSGATFTASYATGNASGDSQIGGLVGYGSDITVIASYATGSVTASSSNVGGLVGYGPGTTVIASYATGRVSGVSSVGGLVGYGPGTTFIASYWDTGTSGQRSGVGSGNENVAGAEGKTTAELQSPTGDTGIYVAWNTDLDNADVDGNPATGAEDFWDFGTSSQYPALKADIDGNGVATWQEFGGQGRVPPPTPPLLPTPPPTVNGKYDGDGDRLIEVSNLEQLSAVRYDVNGDGRPDRDSDSLVYSLAFPVGGTEAVCDKRCHGYELAGPLDFGEAGSYASGAVRSGWTSGSGWEPIGVDTSGRRFSATFDGNGHTVSNLYIDRAIGSDLSSGVGLFGVAGESSVIRGIGLVNAEVHGYSRVGGLVGKHSGTINDSYATGTVTGSDDYVGGLVGENSGQVSDSYAASTVSGGADVGGLVGLHSGTISDSYATGSVTGSGNSVGGLVGRSTGPISDSYATGSVTGSGNSFGGLVGEVGSNKTVIASYATGSVTGSGNSFGGLVGYARSGATFTASYATGNASGDSQIGGLVGYGSDITVIASYATGSVTASSSNVGGLVGYGPGTTVIASYATGRVSGVSSVGGLVGYGPGTTFIASYWDTGTSGQRSGVGSGNENVAGAEGKTTAELQSPTGDTGIYVAWNTDLDNADVDGNPATGAEDFWDFGTSSQYPALKADIDGNGVATWQEFGGQGLQPRISCRRDGGGLRQKMPWLRTGRSAGLRRGRELRLGRGPVRVDQRQRVGTDRS